MKSYTGNLTFATILILCFSNIIAQSTFTVTNTNNDGNGSLAEAIKSANNSSGSDIIEFNISGDGPHTLQLTSTLPDIVDPIIIRGYSEPGAQKATETSIANLMIEIDGTNAGDDVFGLAILADECVVEGLTITNFGQGGIFLGGDNGIIRGNHIGISLDGTEAKGNGFRSSDDNDYDGIWIDGSNNLIGGLEVGDRNVISCNAWSNIYIDGDDTPTNNNAIQGNFIGPDATGTNLLENQADGIHALTGFGNLVGGIESGAGNIISGNEFSGIYLGSEDGLNIIQGNFIGTDVTGTESLGNGSVGIAILDGNESQIGGTEQNSGNLISGNGFLGLLISNSNENIIKGNIIGLDKTGTKELGNVDSGIDLFSSSDNIIGGDSPADKNIIAGNGFEGIIIGTPGSKSNKIMGNNIGVGIDGTTIFGNSYNGIGIYAGSDNIIGGTSSGEGNIIAGNGENGVFIKAESSVSALNKRSLLNKENFSVNIKVSKRHKGHVVSASKSFGFTNTSTILNKTSTVNSDSGYSNSILGNSIFTNENLGIDLSNIARSNDEDDLDVGPNSGQNHPDIQSVSVETANVEISYKVNSSVTNATYPLRIEFFIADTNGQGKTFLGSDVYVEGEEKTIKSVILSTNLITDSLMTIVATATDSLGNTSEFSDPISVNTVVGLNNLEKTPSFFSLKQNYPNPFNPTTTINYSIPNIAADFSQQISLKIYDILGNEVITLVNKKQSAGNYTINFNASNLSSGIYYYTLKSDKFSITKKMSLIK